MTPVASALRKQTAVEPDNQPPVRTRFFPAKDYHLAMTLDSGQSFGWKPEGDSWTGVIGNHWVRLRGSPSGIDAEAAEPTSDWTWLTDYLQVHVALEEVLRTFPSDAPMNAAVTACRGLRILRQDPWECLASFILSSSKQITQIRAITSALRKRCGLPVAAADGIEPAFAFPASERLASATEAEMRACKMGFRAPYLLAAARAVSEGRLDLDSLRRLSCSEAREKFLELPGVGEKIADCVLLFAYGFQEAFPVDTWVFKALRRLYFNGRRPNLATLRKFAAGHFGPNAGFAQQYLFHHERTRKAAS
jgi:N-glycosylase/DNA lyase